MSKRPDRWGAVIPQNSSDLEHFLANFRATIIVLTGDARGMEYVLDQRRISVGRGPGVDLAMEDPSLASEQAVFEFHDGGFILRSLTGNSDISIDGCRVRVAALKSETRFRIGEMSFSYLLEPVTGI